MHPGSSESGVSCRRLQSSRQLRARILGADLRSDAAACRGIAKRCAELRVAEGALRERCTAAKARLDTLLTGQLTDMTRLTAAWRRMQADVATAERALEAARVKRVRVHQEHTDYFVKSSGKCASTPRRGGG